MGLNAESKLDLLGDPLNGSIRYDPALDMQPPASPEAAALEPPAAVQDDAELERTEQALIDVLTSNTDQAIALKQYRNRKWQMYMLMEHGKPPMDDPNDVLIQMGYFVPILAKFGEMMDAILLQNLIPDPTEADWFELDAKPLWPGIEKLAEALTALERDKFKLMCPRMASGFLALLAMFLKDLRIYGNMVWMTTHEIISDPFDPDNQDGLIESPSITRVPPPNIFPWRDDVSCLEETFTSIYDPITPDQAHQMNFVNSEKLFETETVEKLRSLWVENQYGSSTPSSSYEEWRYPGCDQYRRWIGLGHFPFYQVRKALGEQEKDVVFEPDFESMMSTLGQKYGFDSVSVKPGTWFDIEWVGQTIIKLKPYELALPLSKGPLHHFGMYSRNDFLWADGIYDRCQWDMRFFNDLQRAVLTIVKFCAKGVFAVQKDMVDQTWYQMHGSQIKFSPGDVIELTTRPGDTRKFFDKIETNEAAIPLIREQMSELLNGIRMILGIYEDVEGNSQAGTATQASNNLQQGMALLDAFAKKLEDGPLKEMVQCVYVVMKQSAQTIGHEQDTLVSPQEGMLEQVTLSPQDILSLNCIYIRMTGRSSPGNKANLIDKLMGIAQMFMDTGIVDIQEMYETLISMAGVSGGSKLTFKPDQQKAMGWIQNLQLTAGPSWMQYLPSATQQQMGMMISGPEGAGEQGTENKGAKKAPPSSGAPDMMQSSGPGGAGPSMMAGNTNG